MYKSIFISFFSRKNMYDIDEIYSQNIMHYVLTYLCLLCFSAIQPVLPHVQMLWELVLLGEVGIFTPMYTYTGYHLPSGPLLI